MSKIKKIFTGAGRFAQQVVMDAAYIPSSKFDKMRRMKNKSPQEMQSHLEHVEFHASALIAKLTESDLSVDEYLIGDFGEEDTKWIKDKKIKDADSLENAYELMKKIS